MSKLEPIIPETASTEVPFIKLQIMLHAKRILKSPPIHVCDTSATIKKKPRVEREHQRKATIKLKTELIELD